jgi:hypothetical protein
MRIISSFLLLCLWSSFAVAQGLEGIIVERYYQSDAADEANAAGQFSVSPLQVGSITYRVYVDMLPNYKFSNIFGNANHSLLVNTSTYFFNDPNYGVAVNPGTISAVNIRKHTALIDSWFTTGGTCAGRVGAMEADDTDGTVGSQQNILANNPGGCFGQPLMGANGRDGMVPFDATTYVVPNVLGVGNALDVLEQTEGNSITINNGTIAALGGVVGPTSANRVLIGQFTTNGAFSFELNIQIINTLTNAAENYVASNPIGNELTHPTLTYSPNTAPVAANLFPANNATLTIGQSYNLTANVSDNVVVNSVAFYVDNVLLGTDNTAPFSYPYTAASGSHTYYVVATDNECASTTSSTTTFNVTNNLAPTVTLSAPTSAVVGEVITLTATASDSDGSVTQVAFYIDNVLIGTDFNAPYSVNHTATGGLNQNIVAIATDNVGAIGTSNTVVLQVNTNVAPTITITGPNTTIDGTTITITASASDSDGTVSSVDFYWNNALVGSDNTSPYSFDYTPSTGNGQSYYAIATDNMGASTTSNSISIDVAANMAPNVNIVAPQDNDLFIAPANVTITAEAEDADGSVSYVDFYINSTLINTLYAAPYTLDYTFTPGNHTIAIVATDNLGLSSEPQSISIIVADPSAPVYAVQNVSQTCDLPIFCATIDINPAFPVDNIIGYDIVLLYDPEMVSPTGSVEVFNDVVNASLVEATATISTPGELLISVYFNGGSMDPFEFNGFGDLLCAQFERLPNFGATSSTTIAIGLVQESYIDGVENRTGSSGELQSVLPTEYASNIVFWSDQSPLAYDNGNPDDYVPTTIVGYANGNAVNGDAPALTDLNGAFVHNLSNGTGIAIERDVPNNISVQVLINAADAVLAKTVVADGNFVPSIYQLLAMDVNLDGVVSSGDITQIKQRATLAIGEFQQAWNYDNEGNSNGEASKDWIFVDTRRIDENSAFSISTSYPNSDGVGYSKSNVPSVPFVLDAALIGYNEQAEDCPTILEETYQAILLGDINGSFSNIEADGVLRSSKNYIRVDLANASIDGGMARIPVVYNSEDAVTGLDLALQWDTLAYRYSNIMINEAADYSRTFSRLEQTLRLSAFRIGGFASTTFATLELQINGDELRREDFEGILGLINGKRVEVQFSANETMPAALTCWPNPNTGEFQVISNKTGRLSMTSLTGALVSNDRIIREFETNTMDFSHLSPGIYFLQFHDGVKMTTQKIVITR